MRTNLKKVISSIKILQITQEEAEAMRIISSTPKDPISNILDTYCKSIMSIIRLAIYNKTILEWCRTHNLEEWKNSLNALGKFSSFDCEFKTPKKLPVFDLLAGTMLISEYLQEEKSVNQIVILYIAMDIFNSIHATCRIVEMTISLFEKQDKIQISSMLKILEKNALIHGCPGFLLYSWFNERVGGFYLQKNLKKEAAAAIHLGYRFLLTSSKLEKECADELYNSTYGEPEKFFQKIDPHCGSQSFTSMIIKFEDNYQSFIPPIKISAEQKAATLSQEWIKTTKI